MAGQLSLFKGKRQRGVRPPPPKEFALHCMVADILRRWINPTWRFTHLPMGELRDKATAMRLKRMGVMPGWPDFLLIGPGRVFFLELKRQGQKATGEQSEVAGHLMACGCGYLLTDNFEDALGTLRDLGIVRAAVSA
jgi:hypothetical protein